MRAKLREVSTIGAAGSGAVGRARPVTAAVMRKDPNRQQPVGISY